MPVYEYRCDNCGWTFEVHHDVSACDTPHPCIMCRAGQTHRVPQPVRVNWGGLPPSRGELSPELKAHLDPRNVEELKIRHAEKYGVYQE